MQHLHGNVLLHNTTAEHGAFRVSRSISAHPTAIACRTARAVFALHASFVPARLRSCCRPPVAAAGLLVALQPLPLPLRLGRLVGEAVARGSAPPPAGHAGAAGRTCRGGGRRLLSCRRHAAGGGRWQQPAGEGVGVWRACTWLLACNGRRDAQSSLSEGSHDFAAPAAVLSRPPPLLRHGLLCGTSPLSFAPCSCEHLLPPAVMPCSCGTWSSQCWCPE